jgi:hypothetical protein
MSLAKRKAAKWSVADAIEALETLLDAQLSPAETRTVVRIASTIAETALEKRVTAAKQSRDGAGLPIEALARDIIGPPTTRSPCQCEWVLSQRDV